MAVTPKLKRKKNNAQFFPSQNYTECIVRIYDRTSTNFSSHTEKWHENACNYFILTNKRSRAVRHLTKKKRINQNAQQYLFQNNWQVISFRCEKCESKFEIRAVELNSNWILSIVWHYVGSVSMLLNVLWTMNKLNTKNCNSNGLYGKRNDAPHTYTIYKSIDSQCYMIRFMLSSVRIQSIQNECSFHFILLLLWYSKKIRHSNKMSHLV